MSDIEIILGLTETDRRLHRMKCFHRERVEAIQKDQSHVRLDDPARLVVHLIPEESLSGSKCLSASNLKRSAQSIRPLGIRNGGGYRDSRFNADGVLVYSGRDAFRAYSQLFRSGLYEGVMAGAVFQAKEEAKVFRESDCEEALLGALADYLPFAKALELQLPFWMFAALVGCEGARICLNRSWGDLSEYAIDRNTVWLPETKIDAFDIDPVKHLRPMLDVLWNAAGLERSFNYNEQGDRKPRQ